MKIVKITKIKDLKFNNNHPNQINEGSIHRGFWVNDPEVGERFFINYYNNKHHNRGFLTSTVKEIIDENTFRTNNSIYKWEIIKNDDNNS